VEIPKVCQGTTVEKAYQVLDRFAWEESEMLAYEDAWLALTDEENKLQKTEEKGLVKGREEGAHEKALTIASSKTIHSLGSTFISFETRL
jgi:hypothetical protein